MILVEPVLEAAADVRKPILRKMRTKPSSVLFT